ncbi:MAG: S-layer homology domain-containing protein [Deltaproteobacteria bacterium]|nr:S-layer homology domain-containing protein [Deltaproteobacteria bacterium]
MTMKRRSSIVLMILLALLMVFVTGCPKKRAPQAVLDTPAHHVTNGHKLLDSGKFADAGREFTMATELDPKYAPAWAGLALAAASTGDFKAAMENLDKAAGHAKGDVQDAEVAVAGIRVLTLGKTKISSGWLKKAMSSFEKAEELTPNDPAPYYYMGLAYKDAYEFSGAARMFAKVVELNGKFLGEANKAYETIQKIERARPGSEVARKIALVEALTRADAAALFIEELHIDRLFAAKKTFDTRFKSPEDAAKPAAPTGPRASDTAGHVLATDIDAVLLVGVRGLALYPDGAFQPNATITRAEFALMMEDILIKATGDEALATRFIDSQSPFPDIRSDMSYFNAVMVCTSRNIMTARDVATGEFAPQGTVPGADALLAIRQMKTLLKVDF